MSIAVSRRFQSLIIPKGFRVICLYVWSLEFNFYNYTNSLTLAIDVLSSIRAKPVTLNMDFLAEVLGEFKTLVFPSWLLVWGGILGVLSLLVIGFCCVGNEGIIAERLASAEEAASAGDKPRVAIYLAQAHRA